MNNVGAIIRKSRIQNNMTQQEVASITGLSRSYLSDVENGRYVPNSNTLFNIANALHIDLNDFLLTEKRV